MQRMHVTKQPIVYRGLLIENDVLQFAEEKDNLTRYKNGHSLFKTMHLTASSDT